MLIVCPNCATSYDVDMASLRPDGRRVRCVRCRTVWQAEVPRREKLLAAAAALAPEAAAQEVRAVSGASPPGAAPPVADAVLAPADESPGAPADNLDDFADPSDATAGVAEPDATDTQAEHDSPPLAPDDAVDTDIVGGAPDAPAAEPPIEDVESSAARRFPSSGGRKFWRWPLTHVQSLIVALIVADAIVVGWRADLVRIMPQTASFYAFLGLPVNLRGLQFDHLATTTEQHEGVPVLVIGGDIVNITGKTEPIPHLRFAVRNAARQEIYSWTAAPPRSALPPGQGVTFHTRLASPPPDAHDVLVRFVSRYDIASGTP